MPRGRFSAICTEADQARDRVKDLAATNHLRLPSDVSVLVPIARHGYRVWNLFCQLVSTVPTVWSDSIRHKFLKEEWNETCLIDELLPYIDLASPDKEPSSRASVVIGPPTGTCFSCGTNLTTHNAAVAVRFLAIDGQILNKKKVTLRCPTRTCNINYGFSQFGTKRNGYRFYDTRRDAVEGNDTTYMERSLFDLQCSLALHSWVSFEGFTESWNHAFNIQIGQELDRRVLADIFWWGEVEQELRDQKFPEFIFKSKADRETCMAEIDQARRNGLYPHTDEDCSEKCKERGCGRLWVTDGIWKTQFAHCMLHVENYSGDMPLLNLPSVCTEQPTTGKAFCKEHCEMLEKENPNVPTKLREFLEFIGEDAEPNQEEVAAVAQIDHSYSVAEGSKEKDTSVLANQGGPFLHFYGRNLPALMNLTSVPPNEASECRKDLGIRKTLRMMSRGHQFVVRAGGHIDSWTPLYQSESVGQVLLVIFSWLYLTLKDVPPPEWSKIWLAYDNMCQLLRCRASKTSLPLPKPFDEMWNRINKCVDGLHIKNHVDERCKTELHPDKIFGMYPDLKGKRNTQAGEQTFVWLSRFKKIVCSMPKVHHLFYIHRMVKRRNAYTARCYRRNKQPLLPSLRNSKST